MPKPGDHVPEEYLRAAVEDNTPVKPEMVKESAKTELPEGHHPQRRLFKRTRGGEVLSREQVAEIKAGRRKLRGDMRKHGIRGKEQFELTAASLGLYFDKRRGLLFWLLPNKESIYPEYLPDEYNINTAVKKTKTETILEALDERDVEYVFPRELFLQLKQLHPETLLYNKKYDPLHWNQNGAFAAYSQLYQAIRTRFPAVTMLAREEFEITDVIEHYQCISCFPINEPVPRYSLKTSRARIYESSNLYWDTVDRLNRNSFFMRSVNDDPALADTPKLLIFHDSYLMPYLGGTDFLSEHFREVTLIHNLNLSELRFFIQLYRPDLVILESVEREMNPYADYYCYELAWNGFRE